MIVTVSEKKLNEHELVRVDSDNIGGPQFFMNNKPVLIFLCTILNKLLHRQHITNFLNRLNVYDFTLSCTVRKIVQPQLQ